MCGAMMAATLEKNLRPPTQNWSDDMAVGKPRTIDSLCLIVSVYFMTYFSGMFFPYLPISTNDVT